MATSPAPAHVFDLLLAQYEVLAAALGLDEPDIREIRSLLAELRPRSADGSLWRRPSWSAVTDDCTPFEWSLVSRHGPSDLRLLFEAKGDPPSPASYWSAGRDLTEWLAGRLACDTEGFDRLADLFEPDDPEAFFAMWHGIEWRPGRGRPPRVKLYLNPAAGGRGTMIEVTREAMVRSGFGAGWDQVHRHLADAQLSHVAIDLEPGNDARLKIYLRSQRVSVLADMYESADDVTSTIGCVTGETTTAQLPRPGFVVLHFTTGSPGGASRTVLNLHLPSLCATDRVVRDGVVRLLARHHLDADIYARAVDGLARSSYLGHTPFRPAGDDPLAGQAGLHSYLSFQREPEGARVTTYFAPRAYAARFGWGAVDPERTWAAP